MLSTLLFASAVAFAHPEQLVDTAWLAAHATDAQVRVLDVRRSGYPESHVPGSLYLDPESIRDAKNPPTFLPTVDAFAAMMGGLGIDNQTRIVLYDDRGGLLASRVWWMLAYFGHTNVALVDGGWVKWLAERRPTTTQVPAASPARFVPRPTPGWLATADEVLAAIPRAGASPVQGVRIVDARTTGEMDGSDTRNSKRPGIIPSAIPVYWEELIDPNLKTFKSADEIERIFTGHRVRRGDAIIAYCQVGHRSAVDLFALHLIGFDRLQNYLGSWEEWGNRPELPVVPFGSK